MKRRNVDTIVQLRRVRLMAAEENAVRARQTLDESVRRHALADAALQVLAAEVIARITRHEDRRRTATDTVGRLRVDQEYIGLLVQARKREEAVVAEAADAVERCRADHGSAVHDLWRCRQRLEHAMTLRSDERRQRNRRLQRVVDEGILGPGRAGAIPAS